MFCFRTNRLAELLLRKSMEMLCQKQPAWNHRVKWMRPSNFWIFYYLFLSFLLCNFIFNYSPAEASLLMKIIRKGLVESKLDLDIQRKDPTSPLYSVKTFEALHLWVWLLLQNNTMLTAFLDQFQEARIAERSLCNGLQCAVENSRNSSSDLTGWSTTEHDRPVPIGNRKDSSFCVGNVESRGSQ